MPRKLAHRTFAKCRATPAKTAVGASVYATLKIRVRADVSEVPMLQTQIEPYIYFPLMSISEAAKYLGVSRSTIYRLIELDEIRATKQGKAIRVEKMSLDAFRESGRLT